MKRVTLQDLAREIGARVEGPAELEVGGVSDISAPVPGTVVWVEKPRFLKSAETSAAAAVIAAEGTVSTKPLLLAADPRLAFARAFAFFSPPRRFAPGVSPAASVSPKARLGTGVTIQAGAVIEDGAEIGDRTVVQAGAFVGLNSRLGRDCRIYPNAVLNENVLVGDRCIIHAGAVLGGDGFGYVPDAEGRMFKIPQVGRVVLEDDVEIGCNTTIDRATFGDTVIRRGVKLDNLVQIAHNDEIGENTAMAAQVGIAGSTKVGRNCMFGGQVGIGDHAEIGDRVFMAGKTGIAARKRIAPNQVLMGAPGRPLAEMKKLLAFQNRLLKDEPGSSPEEKD